VSGALLDGRKVALWDPAGWLWPHLHKWSDRFVRLESPPSEQAESGPLVWVDWRRLEPARSWLVIRPRCLAAGMGCRRGAPAEELKALLYKTFAENSLSLSSLDRLVSIEAKSDEAGLLETARELNLTIEFFSKTALNTVEAPNPSARVEDKMGVKSVCEAAAILASKGGKLVAEKTKSAKATCAVALISPEDASIS
jgi:cobalt-precorrin 5A hydrolase